MDAGASIIAFAQAASEITKCIVKTYQLWQQIKDLPQDVKELVEEMDDVGGLFADIEEELKLSPAVGFRNKLTGERTVKLAMKAQCSLQELAKDMDSEISARTGFRKKVKMTRIHIKGEKLERYRQKLKRAMERLQLVTSTYSMAMMRQSPELISRKVTTDLISYLDSMEQSKQQAMQDSEESQDDDEQNGSSALVPRSRDSRMTTREYQPSRFGRFALAYRTRSGAWQAYVQWPSWLSRSVFEILSQPSMAGWTYSYRVYNIVPSGSEVIKRVRKGDTNGVLELFRNRKASPYDRDEYGDSLLYYAAHSKKYNMCQLLLSLGLQESLTEGSNNSPMSEFVFYPIHTNPQPKDTPPEDHWERIVELFRSYLEDPESNLIISLFDYLPEWTYGDKFVSTFRERFLPKWYTGPLSNRLEAFRYGSFILKDSTTLLRLLCERQRQITKTDVQLSTHEKLSIVHSVALALGARFADVHLPYKRPIVPIRKYGSSWSHLVQLVASVAGDDDLHSVETVVPWDVHQVTIWRGTPLISLLGGVLCYLSPDFSFTHWDNIFRKTLQRWATDLQKSGVDLMTYGQREADMIKNQVGGALDGDALESTRSVVRNIINVGVETLRGTKPSLHSLRNGHDESNWIPIRILDLRIGPEPSGWDIIWAPEFEWMAGQFWKLIEKENIVMPGSWIDE